MASNQSWEDFARSVARVILDEIPQKSSDDRHVNLWLLALKGLAKLKDCPSAYAALAGQIQLDGQWGFVASAVHLYLGEKCSAPEVSEYYAAANAK